MKEKLKANTFQITIVSLIFLFVLGVGGYYQFVQEAEPSEPDTSQESVEDESPEQQDTAKLIAKAKMHVYTIYTDLEQGSGFLFTQNGDVLTNAHVVKDASYITVKNSDGQEFNGQVLGISETEDLALVRVTELAGKEPLEMEMNPVEGGTEVIAIGSPDNVSNTATEGIISSTDHDIQDEYTYTDLYEMTAKISTGSSGGPLIDANTGRILGINSIILQDDPDIGYAIPIYTFFDQVMEWSENPVSYEEEEAVLQDVNNSYFTEELLISFIASYYELIPYSLNDPEVNYHLSYLLSDSEAMEESVALIDEYSRDGRQFESVLPTVTEVEIGETEAKVSAEAVFTFQDADGGETSSFTSPDVYTIVIDEYGDYQITNIER